MSLEYAILGFLAVEPLTGYDLKRRCIDEQSKYFWAADQAQVYRTLERLSAGGFVKSARQRQSGKPDRKVYRVTSAGLEVLGEWLREPKSLPALRDPFLMSVQFARDLDDEALAEILASTRQLHQARLDGIRGQIGDLARERGRSPRETALRRMALDGAAAVERAAIDWLDDCAELAARGLPGSPSVEPGSQSQLFSTRGQGGAS